MPKAPCTFVVPGVQALDRTWGRHATRCQLRVHQTLQAMPPSGLEMTWRHEGRGAHPGSARPYRGAQRVCVGRWNRGELAPVVACTCQNQVQWFDATLRPGATNRAHGGLGLNIEPHRRPDEHVIEPFVAVEIEVQQMRMAVRAR